MKLRHIALLAVLGASLASTAFAQQGMGPGSGMGPGPGMGQGAGMGPGGGRGMQFNANKDNTWGYQLMSPEERTVHRDKMRATKSTKGRGRFRVHAACELGARTRRSLIHRVLYLLREK